MSFDPCLLAYVESPICILAFDSIFVVILFDCCNPWSSLISLNRGSFDVIVGMDRLSKRKFVIVCHEKVVRIPLEGDEILRVHGERTQGVVKTLMNTKIARAEIRGSSLIGPELVLETTYKVVFIKEKLKAARDRQKSYGDKRRKPLEFEVSDRVLLRVLPWKGVVRFGKKGKLALRYVGPFEILERIGLVAYRLRLPEELNSVHYTFHVSNLNKCLADASRHVPLDEIKVDKTLRFVEEPIEIIDREIKSLKCSKISLVKVRWNSKRGPEFTWEREDYMKFKYHQLFVDRADKSAS
ncbi:hypothetical protein Tco_1140167 [Tanacetum coccineum]